MKNQNAVEEAAPGISNAFQKLMVDHRKGHALIELSEAYQECIAAVVEHQSPATLTLKVKFSPNGGAVCVVDDISTKLPKASPKASIFFATDQNILQRDNPDQQKLDLKEVDRPAEQPLRQVAAAS